MHRVGWLFTVGVSLLVLGIWLTGCQPPPKQPAPAASSCQQLRERADHSKQRISLGTHPMEVEVVTTAESIAQGLSDRPQLGADGMLFLMPTQDYQSFWMKQMLFDLDLLWIKDCQIVEVTAQAPKPLPQTPVEKLPVYTSSQPVDMILEVPADSLPANLKSWVGAEILLN